MRRCSVVLVAALSVALIAVPAGAADQVITANIGSSLTLDTAPTATVSDWALAASGANTTSGGSIGISANDAYTVAVSADKPVLSEYDTTSGAYVVGGKTLATPLSVLAVWTSGTSPVPGIGATATIGVSSLLAQGTGLGADQYALTLSQPTLISDAALPSGRTYRIVLTYVLASTL